MDWYIIIFSVLFLSLIGALSNDSFCQWANCQLSIVDVTIEFFIALVMATFFVLAIEFHLSKYKFWKFFSIAIKELQVIPQIKKGPLKMPSSSRSKKDILDVISFMEHHENVILDVLSIEKTTEIRNKLSIYKEALSQKTDLSGQVFIMFGDTLEKSLSMHKPPFYVMLAAKYFGSLRAST